MSTSQIPTQQPKNDSLIVVTHRAGTTWRCLFARILEDGSVQLDEAVEVDADHALETLLQEKEPERIFSILPGSVTVCRTTTLPDVDEEQILEVLHLQAEAKLLGGTPTHRRGMAPLDAALGETNRVGLIVTWPENSTFSIPSCLEEACFIPDSASIAALLDGFRPTDPLLLADLTTGTITLALSHANGAALRATMEDSSSPEIFTQCVIQTLKETATLHNHTASFIDGLLVDVTDELAKINNEIPMLILPNVIVNGATKRLGNSPKNDERWWRTWGIAVGGLLAATGPLQPLTTMHLTAPELHPSFTQRWTERISARPLALRLVIIALLLLTCGPTLVAGVKLGALSILHSDLESQYAETTKTEKQQIVYKELGNITWPMTKIIADVINNIPAGIDVESIRVDVGEPISIRGRSQNYDGKSAAELIALLQTNLQTSGVFKNIQFSYEVAGTYGDREFDLWATVIKPLHRPKYKVERDYGKWTLAMRKAGEQPGDIEVGSLLDPSELDEGGTALAGANIDGSNTSLPTGVAGIENEGIKRLSDNRIPKNGNSGLGSHSDTPNAGAKSTRIPEPLTPEQINLMSKSEAMIKLNDVAKGLKHVSSSDPETKERLNAEMRLLLDRMKKAE